MFVKNTLTKYSIYIVLITNIRANLCKNQGNSSDNLVNCWGGNYSSFDFNNARGLHFTHNRVQTWGIFEHMTIKVQLFLDYNLISDFNGVPESLYGLAALHLTHNEITKIPSDALTNFTKLTELRLSYNKIKLIEADAFANTPIEVLYLSHNLIKDLSFVNQLQVVRILVLSSNKITSLDSIKNTLPTLTDLDLSENYVLNISRHNLEIMTSLNKLNLANNARNDRETLIELLVHINTEKNTKICINSFGLRRNIENMFVTNKTYTGKQDTGTSVQTEKSVQTEASDQIEISGQTEASDKTEQSKNSVPKILLILFGVFSASICIGGGYYVYRRKQRNANITLRITRPPPSTQPIANNHEDFTTDNKGEDEMENLPLQKRN